MNYRATFYLVAVLALGSALPAKAANPPTAVATPPAESKPAKVLRFDSLTISGEAAKPQVFYLLNRKKIQMRHRPEEKDLIESLEETVEGEPF